MTIKTLQYKLSQKKDIINYSDIFKVIDKDNKNKIKKISKVDWGFEFHVIVKDSKLGNESRIVFYAIDFAEKDLWMHTFKWIAECN